MKKTLLVFSLILIMALPAIARAPQKSISQQGKATSLDTDTYIDVNSILMLFANDGAFATDLGGLFGKTDGFYFPYTGVEDILSGFNTTSAIYAAGLWIGAQDVATGDTLICLAEYSEEYVPGPMANGTFQEDNSSFRVYKLYSDSLADNPNDDYNNWPANQGAPVNDDGTPAMIGDQMLWTVYNDGDVSAHTNNSGKTDPLGIEVQQTVFGFDRTGSLANIVFLRFKVMNKGTKDLKETYVSLWSDPDLGDAGDDLDGCDTILSLGYVYNGDNDDGTYGSKAPAVGFDFFQGPLIETGDMADTAIMWDQKWPGFQNMGMTAFAKYINGTDPQNKTETYNYMQGLSPDGSDYTDDQGVVTTFHFAGDPVTGTGSLDFDPADRRFMVTTGPFDFAVGDSTEILAAIVIGQGSDRLSSITLMKEIDASAQRIYESGFNPPPPPAKPEVTVVELDEHIVLTWTDISEIENGAYPYEGYTVYQGEGPSGPWTLLDNFDLDNDVSVVVDTFFNSTTGAPFPVVVKDGKNTGLQHYYSITGDVFSGNSLRNNTTYYFKVEAYSVDQTKLAGEQSLTSERIVSGIPHSSRPTVSYNNDFDDILDYTHVAGISQGQVFATVVDPSALNGHEYEVTFVLDTVLIDTTYDIEIQIDLDTISVDTVVTEDTTLFETLETLTDTCDVIWTGTEVEILLCVDTTLDSTVITIDTTLDILAQPFTHDTTLVDTCDLSWDGVNITVLFCDSTILDSMIVDTSTTITEDIMISWNLTDLTTGEVLISKYRNQEDDEDYPIIDGMKIKVTGPQPGFLSFQTVANGAGPIDPPEAGAFTWYDFPVPTDVDPDGYITEGQQVGEGHWGIHTGGSGRYTFETFLDRTFRGDAVRIANFGAYDWEWRFTGSNDDPGVGGGYCVQAFTNGVPFWVPFELWRVGIGTPDDASDDVRLIPWVFDDDEDGGPGDDIFDVSAWGSEDIPEGCGPGGCEHTVSGGTNDPFTDWVYWKLPTDASPGTAGYDAFEAVMLSDPDSWGYEEAAVMDRTVLVNWNGGSFPAEFNQDMPEVGTVFRMVANKPNALTDVFRFTSPATTALAPSVDLLENIRAVPNPYYLFSGYDNSVFNRNLKFTNLPEKCTIRIFSLSGDLIASVEKDDMLTETSWDLVNSNGVPIASGIYIYAVEAPGFGQKVGKIAIFVEKEQLGQY